MPEIYSKIAIKKFIKEYPIPIQGYTKLTVPLMMDAIEDFLGKNRGAQYEKARVYFARVDKELTDYQESVAKNRVKRIKIADRPKEIFDKTGGSGLDNVKKRKYLPKVGGLVRAGGGFGEDTEGMKSRYGRPTKMLHTYPLQNPKTNSGQPEFKQPVFFASGLTVRAPFRPWDAQGITGNVMGMNYSGKEMRPRTNRMTMQGIRTMQEEEAQAALDLTNAVNLTMENLIKDVEEPPAANIIQQVLGNLDAKKIVRRKIKNNEMMPKRVKDVMNHILHYTMGEIQVIEDEKAATEFLATQIAKERLGKMKPSGLALETREGFFDREPDRRPTKTDYLSALYPRVNKDNKRSRSGTYRGDFGGPSVGGAINGVEFSYYGKDTYIKAQAERFKRIKSGVFPKGFTMPPRPPYDTVNPFVPFKTAEEKAQFARESKELEIRLQNERNLQTPTKPEILKKYSLRFSREMRPYGPSYGIALDQFQEKYGMMGERLPQSILEEYGYNPSTKGQGGINRGNLF